MKNKKGFTFIETLVVIGITAILATTVVIAVNPAKKFEDARNKQREIHLQAILNAVNQKRTVTGQDCESLPDEVDATTSMPVFQTIGTADGNYDLFSCLVPFYLDNALYDPDGGSKEDTHYEIWQNPYTKRVTVRYQKEDGRAIAVGPEEYWIFGVPIVETGTTSMITHLNAGIINSEVKSEEGADVFERGVIWHTFAEPSYTNNLGRTVDGSKLGTFDSTIHGLVGNNTYYFRAYAKNDIGIGYGEIKWFDTPDFRPVVETLPAENVTHETAVLMGKILTLGESPTKAYFCWGETVLDGDDCPESQKRSVATDIKTEPYPFSAVLSGLTKNVTYSFKACGYNTSGDRCGNIKYFTPTENVPYVVTIYPATNITINSAILWGEVVSDGGLNILERGICYSQTEDPKYENWDDIFVFCKSVNGEEGNFSTSITNLGSNTTYNFRAYAKNDKGLSHGEREQFTTIKTSPRVTTKSASRGTTSPGSGISGGIITNDGGEPVTQKGACWLLSPSIPIKVDINYCTNEGGGKDEFTSNIPVTKTGLWADKEYNVRAYAINKIGTGWADNVEKVGTTSSITPKLTTIGPTEENTYTDSVKNVGGNISDHGGAAIGKMGICWSKTNPMPTLDGAAVEWKDVTPNVNLGTFYTDITGLFADTFYYIRAYAQNNKGISYGDIKDFRTNMSDPPEMEASTTLIDTGENWAKISGEVKDTGGDPGTIRGVCYSGAGTQNPTYEIQDGVNVICPTDGTTGQKGSFEMTISGLNTGITYYALAFAHNNAGSDYGYPSVSFKVGKKLGETCSTSTQCNSGYCVDGVCCDSACTGQTCQTCGQYTSSSLGIGHCGYVNNSSQDPRNECAQGSSDSDGCRSNNCSGNGYSCGVQSSGDGGCSTCKTCVGVTTQACVNYTNNTQDVGCNGTCQACQSGICGAANAYTDPGNKCAPGSTDSDGCRSDYCAGGTASCGVQNYGEGGCPMCKYCQGATSYTCINRPNLTQDTTYPNTCSGINICWNGGCTPGKYYLYLTTNAFDGNLAAGNPSARAGADTRCQAESLNSTKCKGIPWAFLSIDSSDEIYDFRYSYNPHSVITTLNWYWAKGGTVSNSIANNFDDLFDGNIPYAANTVGYSNSSYWTGSLSDGHLDTSYNCVGWTKNPLSYSYVGRIGNPAYTNAYWLQSYGYYYCRSDYFLPLICACLGI